NPVPIAFEDRGDFTGAIDVGAERKIDIAVSVQIACVHDQPSSDQTLGKSGCREFHVTLVFEKNKTFLRRFLIIRKERDGGDIDVPVLIEIAGLRAEGAVQGIKESLLEMEIAAIQVEPDAM